MGRFQVLAGAFVLLLVWSQISQDRPQYPLPQAAPEPLSGVSPRTPPPRPLRSAMVVASTGKYASLLLSEQVAALLSCWKPTEEVEFFVFTDAENPVPHHLVHYTEHQRVGWPRDSYIRPATFLRIRERLSEFDYIYTIDADLIPRARVGPEVLGDLVGLIHPFIGREPNKWTYERNPRSRAYIAPGEGVFYYQASHYGGRAARVIDLWEHMAKGLAEDEAAGFKAVYEDESHLNRYFVDHPPTLSLNGSYSHPGYGLGDQYPIIVEHIDKRRHGGHDSFRVRLPAS